MNGVVFLCFNTLYSGPCNDSSASSVPTTAPDTRVPLLPPIRGLVPTSPHDMDGDDMREGLRTINYLAARRRQSRKYSRPDQSVSLEGLSDLEQINPRHLEHLNYNQANYRRRSIGGINDTFYVRRADSSDWLSPLKTTTSERSRKGLYLREINTPRNRFESPSSSDESPIRKSRNSRKEIDRSKFPKRRGNSLSRINERNRKISNTSNASTNRRSSRTLPSPSKYQQIQVADAGGVTSYGYPIL